MFEFIRKHNRLLQLLLLILILPSFVVFGIQGYSRFNEASSVPVATVDGHKITQGDWENTHRRQAERVRQQMPQVDPKLLDTPEARDQTLDALIRERLLVAEANHAHLAVRDERVARLFASDPRYEMLRNADGSVNQAVLRAQGLTSEGLLEQLRQDYRLQQVTGAITAAPLALPATSDAALDALMQQREVRVQRFEAAPLAASIRPTDAQVEAAYKADPNAWRLPERASIEYVVLDLATLASGISVSDEELRKYYDENAARYAGAQQRHARHILFKAEKGATPDVKQKAKAQAEEVLAQVRKDPASFEAVAKARSQDEGSAAQGGDLGSFGRGAMVEPFEDAVFSMKPGEISNVVESDFGYHVIQLVGVEGGDKPAFDAIKPKLLEDVKTQLAQKRWAEVAEQFTNTVYEQPDSLKPAADKLKLAIRTATVMRAPQPGATGALASARLLDAIFGNDALKNKRNTEAIDIGPNQLAAARVTQYDPARVPPLAEVRTAVAARVASAEAQKQAHAQAEAARVKAAAGNFEGLALLPPLTISRLAPGPLPPPVMEAALATDASKLPAARVADLGGDAWLIVVTRVLPRAADAPQAGAAREQIARAWSEAESTAYLAMLRKKFKVEKTPKAAVAAAETGAASTAR